MMCAHYRVLAALGDRHRCIQTSSLVALFTAPTATRKKFDGTQLHMRGCMLQVYKVAADVCVKQSSCAQQRYLHPAWVMFCLKLLGHDCQYFGVTLTVAAPTVARMPISAAPSRSPACNTVWPTLMSDPTGLMSSPDLDAAYR